MKVIIYISFGIGAITILNACKKTDCQQKKGNSSIVCVEIYEPVCGCDGVTYSNSCFAESNGVIDYTKGECGLYIGH